MSAPTMAKASLDGNCLNDAFWYSPPQINRQASLVVAGPVGGKEMHNILRNFGSFDSRSYHYELTASPTKLSLGVQAGSI
jgi:hypothetical protein